MIWRIDTVVKNISQLFIVKFNIIWKLDIFLEMLLMRLSVFLMLCLVTIGCGSVDQKTVLECKIGNDLVPVIVEKERIIFKFYDVEKIYDRVPHFKDYTIQENASLLDDAIGREVFVRGFILRGSGHLWIHDANGTHNDGNPEVIEGRCSKFVPKV